MKTPLAMKDPLEESNAADKESVYPPLRPREERAPSVKIEIIV